jgi:hypothetical protein
LGSTQLIFKFSLIFTDPPPPSLSRHLPVTILKNLTSVANILLISTFVHCNVSSPYGSVHSKWHLISNFQQCNNPTKLLPCGIWCHVFSHNCTEIAEDL